MKLSLSVDTSGANEGDSANISENPVITKILEKELEAICPASKNFENVEISITFVNSEDIRELNKTYRDIDEATDVLSFPMIDDGAVGIPELPVLALGDIVICPEEVKRLHSDLEYNEAIYLMIVHSFLHLLGYDHDTEEKQDLMWKKQDEIKRKILDALYSEV